MKNKEKLAIISRVKQKSIVILHELKLNNRIRLLSQISLDKMNTNKAD